MKISKKHPIKNWIITLIEFENGKYKVTRRIPEMSISETKFFNNKKKAKKQFNEWLK